MYNSEVMCRKKGDTPLVYLLRFYGSKTVKHNVQIYTVYTMHRVYIIHKVHIDDYWLTVYFFLMIIEEMSTFLGMLLN